MREVWLAWVYAISTLVDYLMPNPLYTYILNIQRSGFKYCYLTLIILFNTIHLHLVKWFQVLLSISNNSIKHPSFVYIELNS